MNKQEFLNVLEEKLISKVNREEMESLKNYYDGYIDEAVDFGMNEEDVISQLGDIDQLVEEITKGLSQENIDISTRELAVRSSELRGLEMDLSNTEVEVHYVEDVSAISIKVDKRFKNDYLVKTIDGIMQVKQMKISLSIAPGFVFQYNRKEGERKFDFNFDLNIKPRKLYVKIPKHYDISTTIMTSNAKIEINEGNHKVQTAPMYLKTSSSKIKIKDLIAKDLKLKTSNAPIKLYNIESEMLEVITSNSKITLENVVSHERLEATTTNSKIALDNVVSKNLRLKTSNAKISLDDVLFLNGDFKTSNSKIECHLKENQLSKHVYFDTSNGDTMIDGVNYDNHGEYIYTSHEEMVNLKVQTSNSKIILNNFSA